MVHVNANLDLQSYDVLKKGQLVEDLADLSDEELYVTFVARDRYFVTEAFKKEDHTFIRVVLPYDEVLKTDNIDLLAYQHLYQHLDKIHWMDVDSIKQKLEAKILALA